MRHASVFSGIGGPEIAATMLGWENVFHCEINPFGRAILDYWFPKAKSYDDITKTDFSEWRGRVDVLTGGFPCQPFSYAGQRRGADDDRYLWPYMFRCIDQIQPAWVVAENVAGILTMVEQGEVSPMASQATLFDADDDIRRYQLRETFTLQRICDDIESHGYAVQPVLIPACAVGAPHRRDRVFIIGRRIASNADLRADRRAAGEDAGESGEERLQERNEVWKPDKSNQIRPTGTAIPEDTMYGRQLYRPNEEQGSERHIGDAGARSCERICGETSRTTPSDTASRGGNELYEHLESEQPNEAEPVSNGWQRNVTNAESEPSNGVRPEQSETCRAAQVQSGRRGGEGCGEYRCGDRWSNFPTVSPVHRGNDGLPFDVDNLSIPFSKWRTESLKAYGNAIVPQVIYEIFRAINRIENE